MNILDKQFGRVGNRMFQMAFCYAYARDKGIDFYYQDPKWFERYGDEIRELFGSEVGQDNRISVHIRRGDCVDNPFYVDLTKTDYYERALAEFPGEQFLVFSDDIDFAKEYFKGNFSFADGKDEYEDLNRMAACKGHIIANSSFSWWGAYIGGGKTVYPGQWFSDGVQRVGFPKEWICV